MSDSDSSDEDDSHPSTLATLQRGMYDDARSKGRIGAKPDSGLDKENDPPSKGTGKTGEDTNVVGQISSKEVSKVIDVEEAPNLSTLAEKTRGKVDEPTV